MISSAVNTRRWQRHEVDLPVSVLALDGVCRTAIPGRGIQISEGGMALYAGIDLNPHHRMELEFQSPSHTCVTGLIRNRTGFYFGLQFLTPLPSGNEVESRANEVEKLLETKVLTPAAVQIFEKIKTAKGDVYAYALLARVLQAAGWPEKAQEAAELAVAFFLRTRDAYLLRKQQEMRRLHGEIEALRRVAPLLEVGEHEQIDPRLPEVICAIPKLISGK